MNEQPIESASAPGVVGVATTTCAQCSKTLPEAEAVLTGGRAFCPSCYASLRAELEGIVAATATDVNYLHALFGAVLGGVVGALAWWGFTVLTGIAFGLIAVVIGVLVGQGTVRFSGGKRTVGLQVMSVAVALVSYICATYLVNMTFINRALAQRGDAMRVGFPPQTLALFVNVVAIGFGVMDVVFVAIVVWEAWKIPRPIALPPQVQP